MKFLYFSLLFNGILIIAIAQNKPTILQVPGINQFCKIDEKGVSVLPSGRFLTPAGELVRITDDPFGMKISPDGKMAATLHNGVFTLIDIASLNTVRVPSYKKNIVSPFSNGSYLGLAFTKDSKSIFLSGGDNGAIILYDINQMKTLDSISLNGVVNGVDYQD
ncbi:MAG: phosphoesterase, partial [Bacteroidetes bacterium]|nr:phosphoesterase [Bacteroidota bacterium]